MGKLTEQVFNESCCDGGQQCAPTSAQPCGCDPGLKYLCKLHQVPCTDCEGSGVSAWTDSEGHGWQCVRCEGKGYVGVNEKQVKMTYRQARTGGELRLTGADGDGQHLTDAPMRDFASGAIRGSAVGKPNYEGYISPLVTKRYGQYMMKHQQLPDGRVRGSDNWQAGMDKQTYIESLVRHLEDLRLHHDGFGDEAVEGLEDSLCAVLFNASGYLFELLKEKRK